MHLWVCVSVHVCVGGAGPWVHVCLCVRDCMSVWVYVCVVFACVLGAGPWVHVILHVSCVSHGFVNVFRTRSWCGSRHGSYLLVSRWTDPPSQGRARTCTGMSLSKCLLVCERLFVGRVRNSLTVTMLATGSVGAFGSCRRVVAVPCVLCTCRRWY